MRVHRFLSLLFFLYSTVIVLSGQNNSKYYLTYYLGGDVNQYHIKSSEFKGQTRGTHLNLDVTFVPEENATWNISIFSDQPVGDSLAMRITNKDGYVALIDDWKSLFTERVDKKFKTRFSGVGQGISLAELYSNSDWIITLDLKRGDELHFSPCRKSKKAIRSVNENIFYTNYLDD